MLTSGLAGAVPIPLSRIGVGLFAALCAMLRVAPRLPAVLGAKLIVMVHLLPGSTEVFAQLSLILKSPA